MFTTILLLAVGQARGPELRMDFESVQPPWHAVRLVDDGARGKAAAVASPEARIDAGPLPVDSQRAFSLAISIRTRDGGFSTPLMAREGERVGLSLVMGRSPGCVSFETWSWATTRLISKTRVDDGAWH